MISLLRFRQHAYAKSHAIDFLKYRYVSAVLSVLLLGTFVGAYVYKRSTTVDRHTFNYSVDFTGGIQTLVGFNKSVSGEKLVHILDAAGWPGTVTREFSPTEHLIRVKKETKDVSAEAENIRTALEKGLGEGYTVLLKQTDSV